jgi:hypothetical protein
MFQRETLGFITLSEIDEDASTATYAHLKSNAEKCVHHEKESGAKGTEVGPAVLLLLLLLLLC